MYIPKPRNLVSKGIMNHLVNVPIQAHSRTIAPLVAARYEQYMRLIMVLWGPVSSLIPQTLERA